MDECLTIPFVPEFSGCLVENPACNFAIRCGFSYHCHHPSHKDFHSTIDSSGERIDLRKRYTQLKESRRLRYLQQVVISEFPEKLQRELYCLLTPKS